jgi:hypothetical protein
MEEEIRRRKRSFGSSRDVGIGVRVSCALNDSQILTCASWMSLGLQVSACEELATITLAKQHVMAAAAVVEF